LNRPGWGKAVTNPPENAEFEALLNYLKHSRGFDFTGYKRSSLMRRVNKRMQGISVETYSDYLDYLQVHPEEFNHLFNTLLINVTSFFRDRVVWDYIRSDVLPIILSRKSNRETIRLWSAGCASGEEVYSLAIMLAEVLGLDQFRQQVKIYATDVDEEALNQARQAAYLERQMTGLTPEQISRFFEQNDTRYTFHKDLRRSVIFGRHDLVRDAPISRIDLLACRNTLMYFNAEIQSQILNRFNFALQDGGFLFLGKAEMLMNHAQTFTPHSLKCRIFTKVPRQNSRDCPLPLIQLDRQEDASILSNQMQLLKVAFETGSFARIIINNDSQLLSVNEQGRNLFHLSARDVGRPFQDLEMSYRPVELRSCIEQACSERRTIILRDIEWQVAPSETIYLDVQIVPLIETSNSLLGTSITFIDVSRYKRLQEELEHSNQELEMAYEELQSTNEELETTNEELQSSNEELETTNEELQSTNEELETMNEELQSANEELQTVNEELKSRSEQLNETNAFLESIMASLRGGVVVVNRDLLVHIWNDKARDLWGLQPDEALGQNFLNLDIGLPTEQLRQPLRACLNGAKTTAYEVVLDAINRLGRSIRCRVTCTPLIDNQQRIMGGILLMEEYRDS
jgi:two-component system, chemotaxis family, CheB/CheR fusion protein